MIPPTTVTIAPPTATLPAVVLLLLLFVLVFVIYFKSKSVSISSAHVTKQLEILTAHYRLKLFGGRHLIFIRKYFEKTLNTGNVSVEDSRLTCTYTPTPLSMPIYSWFMFIDSSIRAPGLLYAL